MKKFTATTALAAFLLAQAPIASAQFADVTASNENYVGVEYAQAAGIVSGYPDGSFKPSQTINRAEFTKIVIGSVYKKAEIQACLTQNGSATFSDVAATEWYAPYICVAKKHGVISGYPDGTFKPAQTINMAEAYKIATEINYEVIAEAGSAAEWYEKYLNNAYGEGYAHVETISPSQLITRGEMTQVLYLIFKSKSSEEKAKVTLFGHFTEYTDVYLDVPKNGGVLVLQFVKNSCVECKKEDDIIVNYLDLIPTYLNIAKVDLDVEANAAIAAKYGISGVNMTGTTYVQVDQNGAEITRWTGGSLGKIMFQVK